MKHHFPAAFQKEISGKLVFFIFCFLAFSIQRSFSQAQNSFSRAQSIKSTKIKAYNYGTIEQSSTLSPNIVTFNLTDSIITCIADHPAINDFLGFQNQFEIIRCFGSGITTKVFFTASEYIFTIDSRMRVIVISKKEISPQNHSIWLEDISFSL